MPKFNFDQKIIDGYYLADYFKKTSEIIKNKKPNQKVLMQFFQRKKDSVLAGIEQVIQLLEFASPNFKDLEIWALNDGDVIQQGEPVLKIKGKYQDFGWLEGMIDGILARNTSIATNSAKIVKAAGNKQLINMNDRADIYTNQSIDGYASWIGGFKNFVSQAAIEYINDPQVLKPSGTMPHALIQAFGGDTLEATKAFYNQYPNVKLVSLVDYHNDCVNTALEVANYFKEKLYAVRLDTSSNLIDLTLQKNKNQYPNEADLNGVNPYLVKEVRKALDAAGHYNVKIIVSSGFDEQKILDFERQNIPVDIYGVGEAIAKVNINFTGDAVAIDDVSEAKFSRQEVKTTRLKKIQ